MMHSNRSVAFVDIRDELMRLQPSCRIKILDKATERTPRLVPQCPSSIHYVVEKETALESNFCDFGSVP